MITAIVTFVQPNIMTLDLLQQARPFSVYLQRQLDSQRLNLDLMQNWLSRPLTQEDFADFAPWQTLTDNRDEEAMSRQLRATTINANRGTIYSADGQILAASATSWRVIFSPADITDEQADEFAAVAQMPA